MLVGLVMTPFRVLSVTVVEAGIVLPAHTVKVSALVLVAICTLLPDPGQVDVAIVMPVEVTLVRLSPTSVPNALVTGSKVYEIVWVAGVDDGFVKTIVWFAGYPGRESLMVSFTDVKLAACAI